MLIKIVKDLHQAELDKCSMISKSKILGVTHDISFVVVKRFTRIHVIHFF